MDEAGPSTYRCQYCDARFNDRSGLDEHLLIHQQQCPRCDFRTSNPHEMDKHASTHKRKAEEPEDELPTKSRRIAFHNR